MARKITACNEQLKKRKANVKRERAQERKKKVYNKIRKIKTK